MFFRHVKIFYLVNDYEFFLTIYFYEKALTSFGVRAVCSGVYPCAKNAHRKSDRHFRRAFDWCKCTDQGDKYGYGYRFGW